MKTIENTRHIKLIIDMVENKHNETNAHKLPATITLVNMEDQTELETTEVMGMYEAMDKSRELHERYNSIFDIERYDEDGQFLGKVNL